MVSSKVALAARVDLFGKAKDGGIGEKFRNHILVNLSKVSHKNLTLGTRDARCSHQKSSTNSGREEN